MSEAIEETTESTKTKTTRTITVARRAAPFLKWAGGKRSLMSQILSRLLDGLPDGPITGRYFEPFVGGGAVFFELSALGRLDPLLGQAGHDSERGATYRAYLGDANVDLVNAYLAVQREPRALVSELRDPERGYVYDKDAYYRIRALDPDKLDRVAAAARTIYLNRCGFNGLYRVNRSGGFNVPFGRYANPTICDEEAILLASDALAHAMVRLTDYEILLDGLVGAREGDLVFCDPPYLPLSATSDFTSYTQDGFSLGDHERLRDLLLKLRERGARWVLSNSTAPAIRSLYDRPEFVVEEIDCARGINSKASGRGKIKELLITPSERRSR